MSWFDDATATRPDDSVALARRHPAPGNPYSMGEILGGAARESLSNVESLGRGAVAAIPGIPGDIESMGRKALNWSFGAGGVNVPEETVLPTTEEITKRIPRVTKPTEQAAGMESLGTAMSPLALKAAGPVARGVLEAATTGPSAGSRAAQRGVIKAPGGNWIKDSVEETLASLKKPPTSRYENPNITESEFEKGVSHSEAINTWIDKKLTPYVKNDMATERDPIRALAEKGITHLPEDAINRGAWEPEHLGQVRRSEKFPESGLGIGETARSWEGLSDEAVQITAPMMQTTEARAANPWLEKLPPNQTIYRARKADIRELGFDHITDVLREQLAAGELTPEALSKVTVADAVKRTHEYDQAAKAAAAKYRAKAAEGAPVAMEFPTGDKLIQLNQPGQFAAESDAMGHSVRGYEPEQGHSDWIKESGNRGSSGYGHGGWEAIKSGKAEVYSLRDPENVSSATIEAKKGKPWNERSGTFYDNPELEPSWRKFSTEASLEEKAKGLNRPSNYIQRYPEWLKTNDPEMFAKHADIFESNPLDITQIKGGGNGSISYNKSEHVKDFLNSKPFGKVNLDQLQGITDTTNEQSLSNLAGDLYAESGKPRHLMIQDIKDAVESRNMPRFISRSDMLKALGLAGGAGAAGAAETKGKSMAGSNWFDEVTAQPAAGASASAMLDPAGDLSFKKLTPQQKDAVDSMLGQMGLQPFMGKTSAEESWTNNIAKMQPEQRSRFIEAVNAQVAKTTPAKKPGRTDVTPFKAAPAEDSSYDISEYAPPADENRIQRMKRLAKQAAKESDTPEGSIALGLGEAALQGVTGLGSTVAGGLAGIAGSVLPGPEGQGAKWVKKVQEAGTYQPKSSAGQLASEMMATPFELASEYASKGAPMVAGALLNRDLTPKETAAMESIGEASIPVASTLAGGLSTLKGTPARTAAAAPDLAGVGAARVPSADLRRAKARELDIPIEMTKGQASRDPMQQKFEKETAKLPEGAPLRERVSQQNEDILSNFDVWAEQTGAEKTSLRAVGEVVNQVVIDKAKAAKKNIGEAYDKARDAGEMREKVPYGALQMYLQDQVPATFKQAPSLETAQQLLKKHDPEGTGLIPINDFEEIRKVLNKERGMPGTPNSFYVDEMKRMIDGATEHAGGDLYKSARRMRENYSKEFTDRAVVSKLLRNKPGTSDRAVALEDVFQNSILSGSLDDVRHMRRVLQTAGDPGKQAWKELQGQTVNHVREQAFSGVKDERGNRVVSVDKLKKTINKLDEDGKLDFIFGKQGADKMRTVSSVAEDLFTSPPSAGINYSNTATVLAGLLDTVVSGFTGIPAPVATAATYAAKKYKSGKLKKKVSEAMGEPPPPPAPATAAPPAFRMDGKPNLQPIQGGATTVDEAADTLAKMKKGGAE